MSFAHRAVVLSLVCALGPSPAGAARCVYEPAGDAEDGHLVGDATWQAKPTDNSVEDLLLTIGVASGTTYEPCLVFACPDVASGETVSDARLRMNVQGGAVGAPLDVVITAALQLDIDSFPGPSRYLTPRTQASAIWHIDAAWDSSGQRIAKWAETPNLSAILAEVAAQPGWIANGHRIALFLEVTGGGADRFVRFDDTHPRWINGGNEGIRPARLIVNETYHDAFWGKELLCRPKPTSVEVNVIPHAATLLAVDWGTSPANLVNTTPIVAAGPESPAQIALAGLSPATRYYYRLRYRPPISGQWQLGDTHSFVTIPPAGQEARVCVTADMHVTNQTSLGFSTMNELLKDTLEYMPGHSTDGFHAWIDLGDLVLIRAQRPPFDLEETEQRYREARDYIDVAGHSVPLLFVRGNHEEVNGWDYDGSAENTTIWSGKMLLKWFPPPLPDAFYSGNATPFPDLGLPGNYWACRIGDLRIRALDPYLFSPRRPHNGHGESDGSLDGWDWQLGDAQYAWLRDDLLANETPYSLLAIHHLTSTYAGPGLYYGRGGIEIVDHSIAGKPTFEWGGQDSTGAVVIGAQRPAWTHGPVHDMLVQLGNQVVMKGHEHFHARQELDGMIYLTVAKPDDTGEQTGNLWGWRFFVEYPESLTVFRPNSGFLSIVAGPKAAQYSYVQTYPAAGLGTILDSFTVLPSSPVTAAGVAQPPARRTWIRDVVPNPSGGASRVDFELARGGRVQIAIYDAAGRFVRRLLDANLAAGPHRAEWDGRDGAGRRVGAGVYFAKLEDGERVDSVKMIVIR
jgi:hypothetical protein